MNQAWRGRAGLLLLMLSWGCEERRTSADPRPVPSTEGKPVAHGQAVPTDAGPAPVQSSETKAAGAPSPVALPDKRLALVTPGGDRVRHIDIHEGDSQRGPRRITLDKAVVVPASSARVRWTEGNHILLTWSAGSDDTSARLYTPEGKLLLEVSSAGWEVSPSARYLVTYPTLFAAPPRIEVYDLAHGRRLTERAASEGTFWVVDELRWTGQQLVASCRDSQDHVQEVRIELDAPP